MTRSPLLTALSTLAIALTAAACDGGRFDCDDDATCDLVEQRYSLGTAHIEGRQSRTFDVDGVRYELVHFEYGEAQDCPSGCFYSHLCTVVVDGAEDYPAVFGFNSESEQLFDPTLYCPDWSGMSAWSTADCDMPAFALPLMQAARFRDWVLHPKDENDEMRWCRNVLANVIAQPR